MSPDPIPQHVNIRKAVTRNARYHGYLGAGELPQFSEILIGSEQAMADNRQARAGTRKEAIELTVDFATDEVGRQFLTVVMRAQVSLECQRCLQQVQQSLESTSKLALVHGDEQAQQLPAEYEPLIAVDAVDLWEVAAEELALALPVVAYHPRGECSPPVNSGGAAVDSVKGKESEAGAAVEASPFNVLSSLLKRDDTQEN